MAGAVLRDSYASSHRWYEEFGDVLAARRDSLDPPPAHDETLHDVLHQAFDDARVRQRGDRLRATLQMIWADELLEGQRRVQADLAGSADLLRPPEAPEPDDLIGRIPRRSELRRGHEWSGRGRRPPRRRFGQRPNRPRSRSVPAARPRSGSVPVRRALPRKERRTVGAWCFVDHMGPTTVTADRGMDIAPHPHIGLQTVTWLLSGEAVHRDSLGSEQIIRPGQLNLMTAGRGVSHSEEATGRYSGELHGAQLWIAQPRATRDGDAAFEHHADLPKVDLGGAVATVLVGKLIGSESPLVATLITSDSTSSCTAHRRSCRFGRTTNMGSSSFPAPCRSRTRSSSPAISPTSGSAATSAGCPRRSRPGPC